MPFMHTSRVINSGRTGRQPTAFNVGKDALAKTQTESRCCKPQGRTHNTERAGCQDVDDRMMLMSPGQHSSTGCGRVGYG